MRISYWSSYVCSSELPERICAAALLAMNVADRIYHALVWRGTIYGSVDIGHLIIDMFVAAVFIGVALKPNRVYPLWLSAFQMVSVDRTIVASGKSVILSIVLGDRSTFN